MEALLVMWLVYSVIITLHVGFLYREVQMYKNIAKKFAEQLSMTIHLMAALQSKDPLDVITELKHEAIFRKYSWYVEGIEISERILEKSKEEGK